MLLPLSECSRLTGVSRSGLLKAITRGRVTASRDLKNGQWVIDSAELSRVYTIKSDPSKELETASTPDNKSELLESEVRHLHDTVSRLENERDDLRRRLDLESEERRKLTALLTGPKPTEPEPTSPRTVPFVVATAVGLMFAIAFGVAGYFLLKSQGFFP